MRLFRWVFAWLAVTLMLADAPARAEPVELKVMAFEVARSKVVAISNLHRPSEARLMRDDAYVELAIARSG